MTHYSISKRVGIHGALPHGRASDTGNLNSNLAPPPFSLGTRRADPPASSIRLRTIARPRPVPRWRVVKNGSQILLCISGATPLPVSETEKTAKLSSKYEAT